MISFTFFVKCFIIAKIVNLFTEVCEKLTLDKFKTLQEKERNIFDNWT